MALKTVRICDVCKGETPEMQTYIRVRVEKVSPTNSGQIAYTDKEVCSALCAFTALQTWVDENCQEPLR